MVKKTTEQRQKRPCSHCPWRWNVQNRHRPLLTLSNPDPRPRSAFHPGAPLPSNGSLQPTRRTCPRPRAHARLHRPRNLTPRLASHIHRHSTGLRSIKMQVRPVCACLCLGVFGWWRGILPYHTHTRRLQLTKSHPIPSHPIPSHSHHTPPPAAAPPPPPSAPPRRLYPPLSVPSPNGRGEALALLPGGAGLHHDRALLQRPRVRPRPERTRAVAWMGDRTVD